MRKIRKCKYIKNLIILGVLALSLFGCKDQKEGKATEQQVSENSATNQTDEADSEVSGEQQAEEKTLGSESEDAETSKKNSSEDKMANSKAKSTQAPPKVYDTAEEGLAASFDAATTRDQKNDLINDQLRHVTNSIIHNMESGSFAQADVYTSEETHEVNGQFDLFYLADQDDQSCYIGEGVGYDYDEAEDHNIFFIYKKNNHSAIWRMHPDRGEENTLLEPVVEFASDMQCKPANENNGLLNGQLYYTIEPSNVKYRSEKTSHLYKCDYNGEETKEIISKSVRDWYVFDHAILYIDNSDNASIHICDLNGEKDKKLNDIPSNRALYDGEYIYYCEELNTRGNQNLHRMSLDGKIDEVIIEDRVADYVIHDDYIYYTNWNDECKLYRMKKDGTEDALFGKQSEVGIMCVEYGRLFYSILTDEGNNARWLTIDLETGEEDSWFFGG